MSFQGIGEIMDTVLPKIKRCSPDEFPVSKDASNKSLIEAWEWFDVSAPGPAPSMDRHAPWMQKTIPAVIDELSDPDLDVCLNIFAQFLPQGLIAVMAALIDVDNGARFYLPALAAMKGGRGYRDSFINIEYKTGFIDRLLEKAPSAMAFESYLSVYLVPKEHFEEAAHCLFGIPYLNYLNYDAKLKEDGKAILRLCRYLILVDHDFDLFRLGVKKEYAGVAQEVFSKLWPDVEIQPPASP